MAGMIKWVQPELVLGELALVSVSYQRSYLAVFLWPARGCIQPGGASRGEGTARVEEGGRLGGAHAARAGRAEASALLSTIWLPAPGLWDECIPSLPPLQVRFPHLLLQSREPRRSGWQWALPLPALLVLWLCELLHTLSVDLHLSSLPGEGECGLAPAGL